MEPIKVYGLLNKHSPYIGFFHYSPTKSRNLNLYFYENVIPIDEVERRKRIKLHPYTGNFHFAPGKYSDLHGLEKYRKSRWKRNEYDENDQNEEKEDTIFDNFLKKMKGNKNSREIINEQKSSLDDSSINSYKIVSRTNSDGPSLKLRKPITSPVDDSFDHLVSWTTRKLGTRGKSRDSDPSPSLDAERLQNSLREWKRGRMMGKTRRYIEECITPPTSPERGDRKDNEIFQEWLASPYPQPRNYSPTYEVISDNNSNNNNNNNNNNMNMNMNMNNNMNGNNVNNMNGNNFGNNGFNTGFYNNNGNNNNNNNNSNNYNNNGNNFGSYYNNGNINNNNNNNNNNGNGNTNSPNVFTFIDPKSSWQIHTAGGSNSIIVQNNKAQIGGLKTIRNRLTDDYELYVDKILGEGSYAKAYLGKSLQSGGYVAIKVISKTEHHTPEEESRFSREIDNQTRLWHHNVVTVRHVYESVNNLYIVLDYCPGGTLDGMLQLRRRLDEEETRFIAYQIFCGMAYIHDNGVLHGDIKPANVMFQPQSISSSSSEGLTTINRVDLLYEKRRREGKLTIALNQAPVVDYDAVKVEKSGGSNSNGCTSSEFKKNSDLRRDAKTAVVRERLVRGKDVISTTLDASNGKLRRNTLAGPIEDSIGGGAGGASGFASAAHRNNLRKKKKAAIISPTSSTTSSSTTTTTNGASISPVNNDSLTANMEQDYAYQGHIRYKCPYGMLLKICDFGLSQKVPDVKHFKITGDIHKAPYTPGGTEGYLAPEIMAHRPYGTAADMWAIGTVLYKCLAGTLPFIPPTACLERDVKFNGVMWKKVSENCKDLIKSLLTVDESARPSAKQCLNHPWFADILLISAVIIPHDAGMDTSDDEDTIKK